MSYTPYGFDEDGHAESNGYGDVCGYCGGLGVLPGGSDLFDGVQDCQFCGTGERPPALLRLAERPSCIECFPAKCGCGIAETGFVRVAGAESVAPVVAMGRAA
jgi:hypothetical protein